MRNKTAKNNTHWNVKYMRYYS